MNWTEWFRKQLTASAEGFEWAFLQIPEPRRTSPPPYPPELGEWSPARHTWHLTGYERCIALPAMQQWMGGPLPAKGVWKDDDMTWSAQAGTPPLEFLEGFRRVRQQQIDLLDALVEIDWEKPRETGWGMKPLSWVVTKTFQHTYEHADTLLRMGLFWDDILDQMRLHAAKTEER